MKPINDIILRLKNTLQKNNNHTVEKNQTEDIEYVDNFKKLLTTYPIEKSKTYFLIDNREVPPLFLEFCQEQGISLIDYGEALKKSKKPTTLIYDQHWNNHGRDLVAKSIVDYLNK